MNKIDLTKLGLCLLTLFGATGIVGATTFNTIAITASLTVPANCIFSTDITTFNFGSLSQGTQIATTQNTVTVTNGGNIASNVFVLGAAWSNGMTVGQTRWARTATAYASATALTVGAVDTNIVVPASAGTNTITWAVNVPLYTTSGAATQSISLSNSC